jgi:hypothetical protein
VASDADSFTDLQAQDLAWWVSEAMRRNFFRGFAPEFLGDLLTCSSACHFAAGENRTGIIDFNSALKLTERKLPVPLLSQIINAAVGAPPRDGPLGNTRSGLEVSERQIAYLGFSECMQRYEIEEVIDLTRKFVKNSRNDSAIGIFVKVAKDRWTKSGDSNQIPGIMEIFEDISGSEFSVLDATDSLSSILNWLRVAVARHGSLCREKISKRLEIVKRKIDAELRGDISDIQKTRVLLIGNLTQCLSDRL